MSSFTPNDDSGRDARRPSRRGAGRKSAQRGVYLGCGTLAVLAGVGLILGVQITREPNAGKVMVGGGLLAIFGIASIIMALTNTMPNDGV